MEGVTAVSIDIRSSTFDIHTSHTLTLSHVIRYPLIVIRGLYD